MVGVKRLLALDIGITTGYAVWVHIQDEWCLYTYGEISEEQYEDHLGDVVSFTRANLFVAERPVVIRGQLGDRLARLIVATEVLLSDVRIINAADWKSSPSKKFHCPRGTSAHVKDAIRLGHWYLKTLKDSRISEDHE